VGQVVLVAVGDEPFFGQGPQDLLGRALEPALALGRAGGDEDRAAQLLRDAEREVLFELGRVRAQDAGAGGQRGRGRVPQQRRLAAARRSADQQQ
jgi:hypothetical protein